MMKLYQYRTFSFLRMFFYISLYLFIIIQPVYFMDHQSLCIIKGLFGIECFLCGMTRACIHLLHFDFKGAFSFHPLSFIVFPILCFIVLQDCINIMKSIKKS
ncbi:MAG: DUF2752 domain-containing protein [Coprobacillus sp.]|nr:DUF2752 domain-containing protein [Coprobacillus sp.]